MTKNTLGDLNNHLFAQLERLGDEQLEGDSLKEEIERSKAVAEIGREIINNGRLVLQAQKFTDDRWNAEAEVPKMLQGNTNE